MAKYITRVKEYDRSKALVYAHKWAFSRNPAYYDFDNLGGDCTNFISQCLYAGSGIMNYTPEMGWYYLNLNKRTPSWSGVSFLYNFIVTNKGPGPFGRPATISEMVPGDVIQLALNQENIFGHSLMVVDTGDVPSLNNILTACHTDDTDYTPITIYNFKSIRFIKIEGVRY